MSQLCPQCLALAEAGRPFTRSDVAEVGHAVWRYWCEIPVIGCSLAPDHWHFPAEGEAPPQPLLDWLRGGPP